jgi:DNA repair exonuclease SbcCD nuclease subunit
MVGGVFILNQMSSTIRFLHTADWQLGKPFGTVPQEDRRRDLQRARIEAIGRIRDCVEREKARFVVVAGDLFDSATPTASTIAECCGQVGRIQVPVYAITGNHDHGGAGSVWESDLFQRHRDKLAPNLRILLERNPVQVDGAILYPCPLLRRHESSDVTEWLRKGAVESLDELPRIVIAHGSIQGFGSFSDDEESAGEAPNRIDLSRIPEEAFDYFALGDWHGTLSVTPKAWYSGTPEPDRFRRGESNDPGNVLVVEAGRGRIPVVRKLRTAEVEWHEMEWEFVGEEGIERLRQRFDEVLGNRVGKDILRLALRGGISLAARTELDRFIADSEARLIRLRLDDKTRIAPTQEELNSLAESSAHPLVASVARRLLEECRSSGRATEVALQALRVLYAAMDPRSRKTP